MRLARSHLELVDAVGGNPCVRYEIPDDLPYPAWISGSSAVMMRTSHTGRLGLAGVGSAEDIVGLIAELAGTGALSGIASVTMPRSEIDTIAAHLRLTGEGGNWDWLWTTAAPPANDAEIPVVELNDAADATELRALNARGLPEAESEPGSGRTELWLGVRGTAGRLVAAGALHRTAAGAPHLAGIVVDPDHRGAGLGAAILGALTRAALARPGRVAGVSTLGMDADNTSARRLYHRLGYRTAMQFASRRIHPF